MNIIFPESHLNKAYSQAKQSSKTQFTFLNKEAEGHYLAVFPLVICRDYFGDALFGKRFNKITSIYGFTWDPKEHRIDNDATRLLIHSPDKDELDLTLKNWHILTEIETANDIPQSTVTPHEQDGKHYLIVEGDTFWQTYMWAMSLYTFIIRCLCTKEFAASNSEKCYKQYLGSNWNVLIKNLRRIANNDTLISGWPDECKNFSISKIHNDCGFVALFSLPDYTYGDKTDNVFHQRFQEILKESQSSTKKTNNRSKQSSAAEPATAF